MVQVSTLTFYANSHGSVNKTLEILVIPCHKPLCAPNDGMCNTTMDVFPVCTPYCSPEHCPADESLPQLIRARNDFATYDASLIESQLYWFHYLDDRAAQYALTTSMGFNAPTLYCCVDDVNDLIGTCFGGPAAPTSYVIRASGYHSGRGVYVLPDGFGGIELLSGLTKSAATIVAELGGLNPQPSKILVEEFIPGTNGPKSLPTEYKFHMFADKIGSITAVFHRGTDCACFAEMDETFERLDQYGCFEPAFPERLDGDCFHVDFGAGSQSVCPMKDLDVCSDPLPPIPACIWDDLRNAAVSLGQAIGVYMRIDMFVSMNGLVYVQEYSMNHNDGLRHCAARRHSEDGCVDSCFLGRCWKENGAKPMANAVFGGPRTVEPAVLQDWTQKTALAQCGIALGESPPTPALSSCFST